MEMIITYKNNSKEVEYLIKKDPILKVLFQKTEEIKVNLSKDYFHSLVQTIVSQQLSSKVAAIIYQRLVDLLKNKITAKHILETKEEDLKSIGISRPKIKYLKSLAEHVQSGSLDFKGFDQMTDEDIINMLIKVKGIGIWTAQMFLMFSMGRQDVFSSLDLGLRNALKKLLNNENMTLLEIEVYSQKWRPYRTIVSHYLWHIWDL